MPKQNHIPVLLREVLETISPKKGESYLDLTAGYGGHANEILKATNATAVLVDRDNNAVEALKKRFVGKSDISIRQLDFLSASQELVNKEERFDIIIADLGVSSPHLDIASRGFSINSDGPLDMRMDQNQALSAGVLVNTYSEKELTRILKEYAQEPKARHIASLIVEHRPFKSTHELANIVSKAWPGYSRVHPATRTFQAIRIAVNDELEQLRQSLPIWLKLLAPGGRLAVISFHSLEDLLVKQFFNEYGGNRYDADLRVLTKKPITAASDELVLNPRARSAKLRVAVKIKTTKRKGG